MGMGKDHRIPEAIFGNEPVTERSNTRTGVNDDYFIIIRSYFETGGIAAVFQIFLSRNRYGTSCTIESNNHYI
jgi:hypothetical protein